MKKIAFFDIDGTLTSEIDREIPESTIFAIRRARENGHLMFINTGRCFQNVETRFRDIGFDGYVCGCGTNVYCGGRSIFYRQVNSAVTAAILSIARKVNIDILFEARDYVSYDLTRPLRHIDAIRQYEAFLARQYDMSVTPDMPGFTCDKFVIWFETERQLREFRRVSDQWFACIDRHGQFREFVPHGCSKATGMQLVLDYYCLPKSNAYAFGDSNNDLSMLSYLPNSIAMGNAYPPSLKKRVSYVTAAASADGVKLALEHFGFI